MNGEDDFAYGSLSQYYDSLDTSQLPFNERPDSLGNTESMCFLAPPTKLNVSVPQKQEKNALLNFFHKETNSNAEADKANFVDFKASLLPSMLLSINSIVNKPSKESDQEISMQLLELAMEDTESLQEGLSRQQVLKTAMMLLPSEAQWYSLNKFRIQAGAPELTEKGIEEMIQYYYQLIGIENRFPLETNTIPLVFRWRSAFEPEVQIESFSIQFEKASVLYNIGATFAQMGALQRLWVSDGKKKAAAYFQKAATVFKYIKDTLISRIELQIKGLTDLNTSTLSILHDLMIAQATECVYEKANDDKVSSPVTSMIATQVADCYELTLRHVNALGKKQVLSKKWISQMRAKANLYLALAHFHAPTQQKSEKTVGERIARLSIAKDLVQKAVHYASQVGGPLLYSARGNSDAINGAYNVAVQANAERHHQVELDHRLLASLKRPHNALINPPELESVFGNQERFVDIFHSMITPTHSDEIKKFVSECNHVLGIGKEDIKSSLLEIESVLGVVEKSEFLSNQKDVNELNLNQMEHKISQLISQLKIYQLEEDAIKSESIILFIKELISKSQFTLNACSAELDKLKDSNLKGMMNMEQVKEFRNSILEFSQKINMTRLKERELNSIFEMDIADFSPLAWSEDKIRALMPANTCNTSQSSVFKQYETMMAEKSLIFSKIQGLKTKLDSNLETLEAFGSRSDLLTKNAQDMTEILNSNRQELREIEEFAVGGRKQVKDLNSRLLSICDDIEKLGFSLKDAIQSRNILDSFESSMVAFIKFREIGIVELNSAVRNKRDIDFLYSQITSFLGKPSTSSFSSSLAAIPSEGRITDLMQKHKVNSFLPKTGTGKSIEHISAKLTSLQQMLVEENLVQPTLEQKPKIDDVMEHLIVKQQSEISRLAALKKEQDSMIERAKIDQKKQKAQVAQIGNVAYQLLNAKSTLSTQPSFTESAESSDSERIVKRVPVKQNTRSVSDVGSFVDAPETLQKAPLTTPEKIKRGIMKFVGLEKSKDDMDLSLMKPPMDPSSVRHSSYSIGSDRLQVNQAFIPISNPERVMPNQKKLQEIVKENQELKSFIKMQMQKDKESQDLSSQVEQVIESRKQKNTVPVNLLVDDHKPELVNWVKEQAKRVKSTNVEGPKRKQISNASNSEKVNRMDSGIGASLGSDMSEETFIRRKSPLKQGHSLLKSEPSIRDSLAMLKMDNDRLIQSFGSAPSSSASDI